MIGTNAVSIETNIPLQEGGRILCRGTHVYLGDDMPDPGLVLAGTKCGDGLVSNWFGLDRMSPSEAKKLFPPDCRGPPATQRHLKGVTTLTSGWIQLAEHRRRARPWTNGPDLMELKCSAS